MKILSKLISLSLILCITLSSTIYATSKESLTEDEERINVEKAFFEYHEEINSGYLERQGLKASIDNYTGKMYKVTYVYDDFIEIYKSTADFKQCIENDDYFWEVPIYDSDGKVITTCNIKLLPSFEERLAGGLEISPEHYDEMKQLLTARENEWGVYRIGSLIPPEYSDILSSEEMVNEFLRTTGFTEPEYISLLCMPLNIYLLYAEEAGIGYGIPFTSMIHNPFKNGQIYAIDDVVTAFNTIKEHYKQYDGLPLEELPLGGTESLSSLINIDPVTVGDQSSSSQSVLFISVIIIVLAALAILTLIGILKHRNKS